MTTSRLLVAFTMILVIAAGCSKTTGDSARGAAGSGSGDDGTEHRSKSPQEAASTSAAETTPAKRGPIYFEEVAASLGLLYVTYSGTTKEKLFPTANGNGLAFVDYDQDGWLDVYFASSRELRTGQDGPPNGLFRNIGGKRFVQVESLARADYVGFTQGLAVGDYNNDGFPDVYLVRYGANILLENNGDGTFSDVTHATNTGEERWGTSAAFFDYDLNGAADIYICHYGKWDLKWHDEHNCIMGNPPERIYCSPRLLPPEIDALYRNDGAGRFRDVCPDLGINRTDGRGQGVVVADVNLDSLPDIYVANDLTPNFLFLNKGNGEYEDITLTSLAAYNAEGREEAGMGVDAGDVNADKFPELLVTNFYQEHNTIYWNRGGTLFVDMSYQWGIAAGSMTVVAWGTGLEDFDNDGDLDVFCTNGHVDDNLDRVGDRYEPYEQQPGLWVNENGRFRFAIDEAGPYFQKTYPGRGAAFGDFDNDGDVDIAVSYKDRPASLLRNESNQNHHWIQIKLVGTVNARDAIGARVDIEAGGQVISRQIRGGRSYASGHDYRLTIGLGKADKVKTLTIVWPGGKTTELRDLEVDREYRIVEPVPGDASPS